MDCPEMAEALAHVSTEEPQQPLNIFESSPASLKISTTCWLKIEAERNLMKSVWE
jgi:hypothetical protein